MLGKPENLLDIIYIHFEYFQYYVDLSGNHVWLKIEICAPF